MTWPSSLSAPSLWLARSEPATEADVVVIGAGFVGLACAYWLRRAGREPLILEATAVAQRASGRNGGFLLTGTAEPFPVLSRRIGRAAALGLWHRSLENRELLRRELLDPGLVECDFVPEGSWIAALAQPLQVEELQDTVAVLRDEGFELEWRDQSAVCASGGSRRMGGAIYQAGDGGLDPVRLCSGLADLADVRVRFGVRVVDLETAGDRVRVRWEEGEVVAPIVIVAVNAYTQTLLPSVRGIHPVRGQILSAKRGERILEGIWFVDRGQGYVRQLADGTVVAGGQRKVAEETEVGFQELPTATVQGAIEDMLRELFPRLANRPVHRRWAGTMAFTSDGLPRMEPLPHLPGAWLLAGFNGHGISLGFGAARHTVRCALKRTVQPYLPASELAVEG